MNLARAKTGQAAPEPEARRQTSTDTTPQPGNLALQDYLRAGALRAKLTVGAPDDPAEAEADRMADHATAPCTCGGTCDSCAIGGNLVRRKPAGPGPAPNSAAIFTGTGQPLSRALRAQFEPRFGADLSAVRLHDSPQAAATARQISARAFTAGQDIGFAPGQFAPHTAAGQKLLAHELAHTLQNNGTTLRRAPPDGGAPPAADPAPGTAPAPASGTTGTPVTAPDTGAAQPGAAQPGAAAQRVRDALADGTPEAIAALSATDIARASTADRIAMINILLGSKSFFDQMLLPQIWDSFGKSIVEVANANADTWTRSFSVAPGAMRQSKEVAGQRTYFLTDVESVASGYLDQNEQFCKAEMTRYGLDETGKLVTGPPTAAQDSLLEKARADAQKIAAVQEAMHDLRKVKVGYEVVALAPGGVDEMELGTPTLFDPEKPPNFPPPQTEPNRRTWDEVKKAYEDLDKLLAARLAQNPGLYPLVRADKENATKTITVAKESREDALATIGGGLQETILKIGETRPMLGVIAEDLEPIQGQLLAGTASIGKRNWNSVPFYAALGHDIVEEHKPGPWWETLGLMAASMAVYVVAALATGGAALAIGLAAKGVADTALAAARADALDAASKTSTTAETSLVTNGQVDEAKADLAMTAAFALIDIAVGAAEGLGVLRSVRQFEQQAAAAAKRAAAAADKMMEKELAKDAKKQLIDDAKLAADEASQSAEQARNAAETAGEDQVARASEEAAEAARQADAAQRNAKNVAALAFEAGDDAAAAASHAPAIQVGDYSLKVRGNWIVRCVNPCSELANSVAERATKSASELSATGVAVERVEQLRPRLNASATRASALGAQAEVELGALPAGDPGRVAIESRFLVDAANIERDVQAVERQFAIEAGQREPLTRAWAAKVRENTLARIETTRLRATDEGKVPLPKKLKSNLDSARNRANSIVEKAADAEKRPIGSSSRTQIETDMLTSASNIDRDLEGIEREERVRVDVNRMGGVSLGETDEEIQKSLGITKGPDYARIDGDTLFVADSKGSDVDHVLHQLGPAVNSSKLPPGVTKFDVRIYLKADVWETLEKTGIVNKYTATKRGGNWFLDGLPEVKGHPIMLLPG
jgi:hypothetical protein